ncbi:MAG TPA: tetratricopeptide repeat protein [Azospirillum sp.]|nr:tetratricopeptide repeat protein [Azospirillum sp.]
MNRPLRRGEPKGAALANPARLNEDGLKLLARGHAAQAAELFAKAVRLSPEQPEYRVNLGRAYAALGDTAKARAALSRVVALFPAMADLYGSLGNVLEAEGANVPALACYRRALRLDPGHYTARNLDAVVAKLAQAVHGWHLPMLADTLRNDAFQAAIEAAVRPDDVVLDIGTGSGLLAMMAARAGAGRVYGCEMLTDLAELAKIVVAKNGFADRVTVIPKPSTGLEVGRDLPARATLLVTETFDSLVIGEGILGTLRHAHEHLLAPGARVVPAGATLKGQLVNLPRLKALHPLKTVNGFDLSAFSIGSPVERFYPVFPDHEEYTALTAPFDLLAFDFTVKPALRQSWSAETDVEADGTVQALLLSFDLHLDADTVISTTRFGAIKHWNPVVFVFDDERTVRRGDRITINGRLDDKAMSFSL